MKDHNNPLFLISRFSLFYYTLTMNLENTIVFTLGREWKLSLAELVSIFGQENLKLHTEELAFFDIGDKTDVNIRDIFSHIGGSIRVIRLIRTISETSFVPDIVSHIRAKHTSGKCTFAIGSYGRNIEHFGLWLKIKKILQEKNISARLVNQENKNINSASYKNEKLSRSWNEYNYIRSDELGDFLWVTLACQDIDSYAKRDTAKIRDMEVGMLPPKLAQMMINLSRYTPHGKLFGSSEDIKHREVSKWAKTRKSGIYDPFCGLGTVLIEAANMGYESVLGSDLSKEMVEATSKSLEAFIAEEKVWQERIRTAGGTPKKDFTDFDSEVFSLDAKKIGEKNFGPRNICDYAIVSEGYLGEIMQKESITLDRVKEERSKLARMYDGFFAGLKKQNYTGTIVMTFPFWDIRWTQSFFVEIEEIRRKYGFRTLPFFEDDKSFLMTPKGTILYKRPGQNVGREIWRGKLSEPLWH
jgi:tRNA G10  N-methylase Trm11